jgi:hypothetical protein
VRPSSFSPARGKAVALSAAFLLLLGAALTVSPDHPARAAQRPADAAAPRTTAIQCGHGVAAVAYTPAAGFDPLTATDSQLLASNLPMRPSGSKAMAIWRKFVTGQITPTRPACDFRTVKTRMSAVSQPVGSRRPSAASPSTTLGACNANWAGNQAFDTTYEDAYGTWTVPLGGQSSSGDADSSSWVGIGATGTKDQPIIQGGSESDLDNSVPYYLWWEVVTNSKTTTQEQVQNKVHFRDTIYVHIHFVAGLTPTPTRPAR